MKEVFDKILFQIDLEIDEIDLYGYDIIETSLSMVHRLQSVVNDLRNRLQTYVFQHKKMKFPFSRHRNRKYLVVYYSSTRFIG